MLTPTRIALVLALATSVPFVTACGDGAKCADGAYKNAETNVCLKLPPGYKADDKVSKSGETQSIALRDAKTSESFTIWIDKPDDLDKRAKSLEGMANSDLVLVEKGDTSPGKGKFFHFHNPKGNYEFANAIVSGKSHFYRCEIQNTPAAVAKPMIEACKTMNGP
jgi:hypothetical protein